MIICGTRAGLRRWSAGASLHPQHFLLAPTDLDPGSVEWPVAGAQGICLVTAGASDDYVLRLTQALLADGAEMIVQLRDPHRASIHYRRTE